MCKLMRDDRGNYLFFQRGGIVAHQQSCFPKSDESPILHGSCQEVWDGYQVWEKRKLAFKGVERPNKDNIKRIKKKATFLYIYEMCKFLCVYLVFLRSS